MPAVIQPHCITDPLTQSNCYILTVESHALIIDPNCYQEIHSYLASHQLVPEYIILTHEHCDHIAALNDMRKNYDLKVLCSAACSQGIQSTTLNMTRIMETYLYFKSQGELHVSYPPFICQAADIVFNDIYLATWRSHAIFCIAAPGHTPGSICIIIDEKILFSGDYFIPGEEVITRLPGGDEAVYEQQGKATLRCLPTPILTYPGHGGHFILTQEVKKEYGLY